jgi:hypothetical protein
MAAETRQAAHECALEGGRLLATYEPAAQRDEAQLEEREQHLRLRLRGQRAEHGVDRAPQVGVDGLRIDSLAEAGMERVQALTLLGEQPRGRFVQARHRSQAR